MKRYKTWRTDEWVSVFRFMIKKALRSWRAQRLDKKQPDVTAEIAKAAESPPSLKLLRDLRCATRKELGCFISKNLSALGGLGGWFLSVDREIF